jgi:hypothetical protein
MSDSPQQDELVEQTPNQVNCGAAKASDFIIEDRDGGQHGDTKAERAALLGHADKHTASTLDEPIPDRNEVPHR